MKIIGRLLLWSVGLGIIYYGLQTIPLKELTDRLARTEVTVDREKQTFLEDWTEERVLETINEARRKNNLTELRINSKLKQAAASRLSVILTEDDYEGKITGVTRDASVKNSGYTASLIGDLVLLDFFKTNDPIETWEANVITKETLYHKDFREVGVAVKNEVDRVQVYVILVASQKLTTKSSPTKVTWGGPELWTAVNKRRVEMGVNPLAQKSELCTIASIRLNQLLELQKLDGHSGFAPTLEREDLKWIAEKYNISEYLAQGYATAEETVKAWENTLGHRSLLAGGEYVWGCTYAQNSFAVAIAAY